LLDYGAALNFKQMVVTPEFGWMGNTAATPSTTVEIRVPALGKSPDAFYRILR